MKELFPEGPVEFNVFAEGIRPGAHGCHIHRSGNLSQGSTSLCDHYNPFGDTHGDLNEENAHVGDLGNILVNENGISIQEFVAERVRLRGPYSVIGRSIVIHEDPDDLGRGPYTDSKTTGHSGSRVLWGIIAIDEDC
jgi:Cu-Zn family superoxide dismutase